MRTTEPLTIPIRLDRRPDGEPARPLHGQITEQLIVAVDQGRLPGGMRVPSTRTLATLLGVSRGVAAAAYTELLVRGYLEARRGSGTYVATRARVTPRRHSPRPPALDLTPGHLVEELFPAAAWSAAWRQAAAVPPPARVPVLGAPELRNALVRQALWPMGLSLDHHAVAVTGGMAHGLRLVLTALAPAMIGLEDPAPSAIRRAVGPTVPVPLDERGALPEPPDGRGVLVVAPDGQLPLGTAMTPQRRQEVVAWARRTGGTVVVLAPATPATGPASLPGLLAAAGVERMVLVGAVGGSLSPALQLGYLVVPAGLAAPVADLLRDSGERPSHVVQLAAARLLRDGTLHAHGQRLTRLYAYKRRFLESALAPLGDRVRLGPPETVGATALYLPPDADAGAVATTLAMRRVRLRTLASYHWTARPVPPALVIGYGHPTPPALRHALATLTHVLRA